MILVDSGSGSSSLLSYPPLSSIGILTRLPSPPQSETRTDVAFDGCGPLNSTIKVGIEVKEIGELITSLSTGRLQATQLPGLLQLYDIRWLCIVGEWRRHRASGNLQIRRLWKGKKQWFDCRGPGKDGSPVSASYLDKFLCGPSFTQYTDQSGEGVRTWCVPDLEECAQWIGDLYSSWQEPYESHTSMRVLDRSGNQNGLTDLSIKQRMRQLHDPRLQDPHFAQKVRTASSLPGVSYTRAIALAETFPSVQSMISPLCTCDVTLDQEEEMDRRRREDREWSSIQVEDGKGKKRKLGKVGEQIGETVRRRG